MTGPPQQEAKSILSETITILPTACPEEQDSGTPLRVLAFDLQTTCAKLFGKSLSNYLKLGHLYHPYVVPATLGPERVHLKIGNEQTRMLWEARVLAAPQRVRSVTYEHATNKFLTEADQLEQKGKALFVVEFAPFVMKHEVMLSALRNTEILDSKMVNPTFLSDDLLDLFTPIIFIQHPAIVIPAWLRLAKAEYGSYNVDEEDFAVWTSLRWSRILFDYLRHNSHLKRRTDSAHSTQSTKSAFQVVATRPYVIDAVDVANNPHGTLATVCRLLNIELGENSSWSQYFDKATETFKKVIPDSLMKVFNSSVLNTATSNVDVDHEMAQWKAEFGDEVAGILRQKVTDDMPHYEYLMNFKIQIAPSRTMTGFMKSITGMPNRRESAAPKPTGRTDMNALNIIRTAVDGPPRDRHFSC